MKFGVPEVMLDYYTIPKDLCKEEDAASPLAVIPYQSKGEASRRRVMFDAHVLSFLVEGRKTIHLDQKPLSLSPDHFVLISKAKCLMTEISPTGSYQSLLFCFQDVHIQHFCQKYLDKGKESDSPNNIVRFYHDKFTQNFQDSLNLLVEEQDPALLELKLEEILLYLYRREPALLYGLLHTGYSNEEIHFRRVIEHNLFIGLTLEELAFLCHMSLSTFKRTFRRYYGTAPSKWMRQERMKAAGLLLQNREAPGDIFVRMGYDSYANFARAFKQYHKLSPRQYQRMNPPA